MILLLVSSYALYGTSTSIIRDSWRTKVTILMALEFSKAIMNSDYSSTWNTVVRIQLRPTSGMSHSWIFLKLLAFRNIRRTLKNIQEHSGTAKINISFLSIDLARIDDKTYKVLVVGRTWFHNFEISIGFFKSHKI